jgi:hypothetical protein
MTVDIGISRPGRFSRQLIPSPRSYPPQQAGTATSRLDRCDNYRNVFGARRCRIVQAARFFEFVKSIGDASTDGNVIRLAPVLIQPWRLTMSPAQCVGLL